MKKLKRFSTETQYNLAKDDLEWATVSWVEDVNEVRYMSQRDKYKREYLTFEALESGIIGFYVSPYFNQYLSGNITSVSYSTDGGETWVTENDFNEGVNIQISVNKDDKILWKGVAKQYSDSNMDLTSNFYSTKTVNVSGNIMSMIWGDEFKTNSEFKTDSFCVFYQFFGTEFYRPSSSHAQIIDSSNLILPANNLVSECYSDLFYECGELRYPPELPATTLAENCYKEMFRHCETLTVCPTLPATVLTQACYASMFLGCTSLTTTPSILPATTLANYCYEGMFQDCTSLTTAPELPATTLANDCYRGMFYGCSNLNYIKAMFTTTPSATYTDSWVSGVAATGTFIKNPMATWNVTGVNGVPTGWTIEYDFPVMFDYFKTRAIDNSAFTLSLAQELTTNNMQYVEYSLNNGETWIKTNNVNNQTVTITTPTISAGDYVLWRGLGSCLSISSGNNRHSSFSSSGRYEIDGNIMSLISCSANLSGNANFICLFMGSTNLVRCSNSLLPSTTLIDNCYYQMFKGCTSLTTAPNLPATTGRYYCYGYMFQNCTSLTTVPTLSLRNVAAYSCYSMFKGCTSLTTPVVPTVRTLETNCYGYMFENCTSLTIVPTLTATVLAYGCYMGMFKDCTSLTSAPFNMLPTTTLADYCYSQMFMNCRSLTTAPILSATTLVTGCYKEMFRGCTNLNYINAMFTTTPTTTYTDRWVLNVAATGTFVKNVTATWNVTGTYGIPNGWTVEIPQVGMTIWVDDFHDNSQIQDALNDPEASGANGYVYTGNTITYQDQRCYLWQDISGAGAPAYLLTTTDNITTLEAQSIAESGYSAQFTALVAVLDSDNNVYENNNNWCQSVQLIIVVPPRGAIMGMWIDDFPEDEPGMYDGNPIEDLMDNAIADPEYSGANLYNYYGDTMEFEGEDYYVWTLVQVGVENVENYTYGVKYLLTTTDSYSTLSGESMEEEGYNAEFTSLVARFDEDQSYITDDDGSLTQKLITVFEY